MNKNKPSSSKGFGAMMRELDAFKVEHNFQFTSDGPRGTGPGVCFTFIYFALLIYYFYNRVHLFWSHEEDNYSVYNLVNEFEDGPVDFKETKFTKGVILQTTAPEYQSVLLDEVKISEYINIYSA